MKNNKTGLIFFPAFDWAISPTHPEREERLLYTRDQIFEEGLLDFLQLTEYKPKLAGISDIERVHICVPGVSEVTTTAHLIAAGCAIKLGDALMKGEIKNGFALVRPPGHHAMRVVHGNRGFCNINNEAILVEYLRKKYGLRKIAIADTDVHHGDGTQDIFYHDPDILYISLHQDGRTLYPGSGFVDECGGPGAYLKNINIPLFPGTGDEGLLKAAREIVTKALQKFKPELVINSAGQDNHFTDPLANMRVTAKGYARLTEELKPDLAVLEGGYAIETALPYVNMAILLALLGEDYSGVIEPQLSENKPIQSKEAGNHMEKLVSYWQERLEEEPLDKEILFGPAHIFSCDRNIFYDTDMIHETRHETVKYCPDCPGLYEVVSRAMGTPGNSFQIWALSIPMFACCRCATKGYEKWEKTKKGIGLQSNYDILYLQDKLNDLYLKEIR